MKVAADMTIYVQPVTTERLAIGVAWVDVTKTAVIRGRVGDVAEAQALIDEAVRVAEALGGRMGLKILAQTPIDADRSPSGVKKLNGTRLVGPTPELESAE